MTPKPSTPFQRFMKSINTTDPGKCWEWQRLLYPTGYGLMWNGNKIVRAHRFSYQHFIGPIPEGMEVCHKCNNKLCVNPDHLYVASHRKNVQDAVRDGLRHFGGFHGEEHPRSILTDAQVIQIRKEFVPYKVTKGKLAQKYGVSEGTIKNIIMNRTWRHLL